MVPSRQPKDREAWRADAGSVLRPTARENVKQTATLCWTYFLQATLFGVCVSVLVFFFGALKTRAAYKKPCSVHVRLSSFPPNDRFVYGSFLCECASIAYVPIVFD